MHLRQNRPKRAAAYCPSAILSALSPPVKNTTILLVLGQTTAEKQTVEQNTVSRAVAPKVGARRRNPQTFYHKLSQLVDHKSSPSAHMVYFLDVIMYDDAAGYEIINILIYMLALSTSYRTPVLASFTPSDRVDSMVRSHNNQFVS